MATPISKKDNLLVPIKSKNIRQASYMAIKLVSTTFPSMHEGEWEDAGYDVGVEYTIR